MPKARVKKKNNLTWTKGEPIVRPVPPPGAPVGEPMPTTLMKGKVPADENMLIVWDNRQRIP